MVEREVPIKALEMMAAVEFDVFDAIDVFR